MCYDNGIEVESDRLIYNNRGWKNWSVIIITELNRIIKPPVANMNLALNLYFTEMV